MRYDFASDNTSGICPEAWEALEQANTGFIKAYGSDTYTQKAADLFRETFETDCEIFFVFNGTAANSLALASLCQSYHSVIAHEFSHIETDECGAPEFFSNGTKLLLGRGEHGKLSVEEIERIVTKRTDIHYPRPNVVSVTVPTELGTLYVPEEVKAISEQAKKYGLKVHMDGTRFANALAALQVRPSELTWKAGVDVLCCGGTKSGIGFSEAVIFFNRELAHEFDYRCKQAGQLASKMRYLTAPWATMLQEDRWIKRAEHANACALRLKEGIENLAGVKILYPVQANGVFAELPEKAHAALQKMGWGYYVFIGGGARFMCSWATTFEAVDELVRDIQNAIQA